MRHPPGVEPLLGLIDYGAGNFSSVRNALQYLDVEFVEVRSPSDLEGTSKLILPGVGAFATAMNRLSRMGMIDSLAEEVLVKKKQFLGICVGMQILAGLGHEFERLEGLGWVEGDVRVMEPAPLPLPHIGWNDLDVTPDWPLVEGFEKPPTVYFVHSYSLNPVDDSVVAATCEYGTTVVAAVHKDNVHGVQFHPEKSQRDGLRILSNFARLAS